MGTVEIKKGNWRPEEKMKGWEMLFRVVLKQFDINGP